jgi:lysozyme family protein
MANELGSGCDRRALLGALASALLVVGRAASWAQGADDRPSVKLSRIEDAARGLGIDAPLATAARSARLSLEQQDAYSELMPRLVDLIERARAAGPAAQTVATQARELLSQIHAAERGGKADDPERRAPASFDSVKGEYRSLFDSCQIRQQYKNKVDIHVGFLRQYKARYQEVGGKLGIPWHFIGPIHCMEAGFQFDTHLHNGDPLTRRTVHVPKGQPVVWNPPNDWESSAEDALKALAKQQDWSLEHVLYRWEAYNGWGYRGRINSPYLWSFTTHYSAGKYVKDGVFDPKFVSSQCGTVAMLKGLIENGEAIR